MVSIHLISNKFVILGFLFGAIWFFYGLRREDRGIKNLALYILIFSALMTIVTYFSGHNSEEIVEKISGISHEALEIHEKVAILPFSLSIVTGILSAVHLFKNSKFLSWAVLILSLLTSSTALGTAYWGGEIRHHEELRLNQSIE